MVTEKKRLRFVGQRFAFGDAMSWLNRERLFFKSIQDVVAVVSMGWTKERQLSWLGKSMS